MFWTPALRERLVEFVPTEDQEGFREWLLHLAVLLRVMESYKKFDLEKLKAFTRHVYRLTLGLGQYHQLQFSLEDWKSVRLEECKIGRV